MKVKTTKQKKEATLAGNSRVSVVITGHVDHGKSTVVGRLLADTGNLPDGKLEALSELCRRNAKPLEYAFLLDALKDERSQGITIDSARCFLKSAEKEFILIDAPGHIEFVKNMVSGAARADAALLVIDAKEGVQENTRRHGYVLSMLGIDQFYVCVNKMDLVGYDRAVYDAICRECGDFLEKVRLRPLGFIPLSAHQGEQMVRPSDRMPWYAGPTLIEGLHQFHAAEPEKDKPLRLPVQDVYKFTALGDERRIVAGRIETGRVAEGDAVVFFPSGKRAIVKRIEAFQPQGPILAEAGVGVGLVLNEKIYITRGELMTRAAETAPRVGTGIRADLFWLHKTPGSLQTVYSLKLGTAETGATIESFERILDASSLTVQPDRTDVRCNEMAECVIRLRKPLAFDRFVDSAKTGRFVLVDKFRIVGGGIIRDVVRDETDALQTEALRRNEKWVRSLITADERAERYSQRAGLVVITGPKGVGRKQLAHALEKRLFQMGRLVYCLGMGSVVYGLDADIRPESFEPKTLAREHIRRLGEMLHVLMDAGMIVICTAVNLKPRDLADVEMLIRPASMLVVRLGDEMAANADAAERRFSPHPPLESTLAAIVGDMKKARMIPDL